MCDNAWNVRCNPYNGLTLNGPRSMGNVAAKSVSNTKAVPIYIGYNGND